MKAIIVAFIGIIFSSAAIALDLQSATPGSDSLGVLFLLVVGIICLVIARRRSAPCDLPRRRRARPRPAGRRAYSISCSRGRAA
ncbi:MAG: hypothetical protein ACOY7J_19840 [Pseudomonadota bacterium]